MVPIGVLVDNALALSARLHRGASHEALEIFHITGQAVSNALTFKVANAVLGIDIQIGEPETTLDFFADKICSWVKRFGNGGIAFDDSQLRQVLGTAYVPTHIGEAEFMVLFDWYRQHLASIQGHKHQRERMKQPVGLELLDRFGPKSFRQRFANRMLRCKHSRTG